MNNLILIAGTIFVIALLMKPNKDYNPSQTEIQNLTYVDKTQFVKDFPFPQISGTFHKLSNGVLSGPLNNESEILPNGKDKFDIVRHTQTSENIGKRRMYLPDHYRKDRLDENPAGTEELRPFLSDSTDAESSWTDKNVSEHPKFYNADIKDELTNIGAFFDKNNQYHDKNSSNTLSLHSDKCYEDKSGTQFCMDNTRIQNIPPRLITDPTNCTVLNEIGVYKDRKMRSDINDRVINGGAFFSGIYASQKKNEVWSSPVELKPGDCDV